MMPRFAKVSEIAERFRVSVDAVYLWIRQGKIPPACVVRIAGTVRLDEEEFERRLRSGSLYQTRGRKPAAVGTSTSGEDNFTTVKSGSTIDHRWSAETGDVKPVHPYSPEMMKSER